MPRIHHYYVYILSSRSRTLYIGVTNTLLYRVEQHRTGEFDGFTSKYRIHRLVYFERFQYVNNAIAREKQLKGWLRERKLALVEEQNPTGEDLYPLMMRGEWKEKQVLRCAQDDNTKGIGNAKGLDNTKAIDNIKGIGTLKPSTTKAIDSSKRLAHS